MLSTTKPRFVNLTTAAPGPYAGPKTKDPWVTTRYAGGGIRKGRAVTKKERPTYDRATAAMLAGRIHSWTVYEDGWVFTTADGTETACMTLVEAGQFLDHVKHATDPTAIPEHLARRAA